MTLCWTNIIQVLIAIVLVTPTSSVYPVPPYYPEARVALDQPAPWNVQQGSISKEHASPLWRYISLNRFEPRKPPASSIKVIPHLGMIVFPSGAYIQLLPHGGGYLQYGNQRQQYFPSLADVISFIQTQVAVTTYEFFHNMIINLLSGAASSLQVSSFAPTAVVQSPPENSDLRVHPPPHIAEEEYLRSALRSSGAVPYEGPLPGAIPQISSPMLIAIARPHVPVGIKKKDDKSISR